MIDPDSVCVLVPTLNEAGTIGSVLEGFRREGFENLLVVDGNSTDGTRRIAEEHGARVVVQSGSGKGQAVREGLEHVDAPVVLMADGDGTYLPEDARTMLEPVFDDRADHVIGNRFANLEEGAMTAMHRFGNRVVNRAFRFVHGRDLVDILSGYRAFTLESVERFSLAARGFGIETEMAVECVKHGTPTEVVSVTYRPRPAESEANLDSFRDGARIFATLFRLAKTNNPLFYFGSVGTLSALVGVGLGAFVAYDFLVRGVSHEAIAVVSTFAILLGVQLAMFGVLSDIIVAVNREQTRRLEELAEQLSAAPDATDEREAWRSGDATGNPSEREARRSEDSAVSPPDGDTREG